MEERKKLLFNFFSSSWLASVFFSFIDFFFGICITAGNIRFIFLDSSISVGPYIAVVIIFFAKKTSSQFNKMLDGAGTTFLFFQSTIFFLFLFFFRINVLTSSLTSVSKSFNISRMRSPSELEAVDKLLGDLLAMIGDDKGVS